MKNSFWSSASPVADSYALFRGRFDLAAPASVELRVVGAAWYRAWLDGRPLLEGPLRFALDRPEYQSVVLDLSAGEHVLAFHAHHIGVETRLLKDTPPFLWCEIHADGGQVPLQWRCFDLKSQAAQTRRINPQLGWIEWRDTRLEPEGWEQLGFDDAGWTEPSLNASALPDPVAAELAPVLTFPQSWLRSDNSYAAYDSVSVTEIASVENAMNYSSAAGYSVISSVLTGSGKVTVNAGTGGLTLSGANTHTGGTEVIGGTLFVAGDGTLGAASGNVTVTGTGGSEVKLDLRNQQTRTGTITMTGQNARIIAGDVNNVGSLVNNGSIQFGGGKLDVAVSGSGGMDVTGGGTIDSSNSYTGATTISATTGWYGTGQLFVNNANALGAASSDLTISGGNVNLQTNTISRSGNVTISGGTLDPTPATGHIVVRVCR